MRTPVLVLTALAVAFTAIFLLFGVLTPQPDLRPSMNQVVVVNQSGHDVLRIELRSFDSGALLAAQAELAEDDQWVVERELRDSGTVGLVFSLDGKRYTFAAAAQLSWQTGDLYHIRIMPGPRLKSSLGSSQPPSNVLREAY